jgi:hypothetical protein
MSKDGGSAFPTTFAVGLNGDAVSYASDGMSLRDYIAIHATDADVLAVTSSINHKGVARYAARYIFADAMLKERGNDSHNK